MIEKIFTSAILLAGGKGKRMNSKTPKQFMELNRIPIASYSFNLFLQMPEISEVIVVCERQYQHFFKGENVRFALPGNLRQESVFNGLQAISENSKFVCVHDSARPFITRENILEVLKEGHVHGAATLAMPIKFTVKEATEKRLVKNTPNRENLWEIQTPQVVKVDLIREGFKKANGQVVTDDVSLAEIVGASVKLVKGSYKNIKITTPEDLKFAEQLANTN